MALAHALQDNLTQKEQLLRVQLATSLGKPPVSLLQQCTNILSQVGRLTLTLTDGSSSGFAPFTRKVLAAFVLNISE